MLTPGHKADTATATGIGAAVVAVVCCAGLPALGALLGGLTLVAWLGLGLAAAILASAALTVVAVVSRRRDRTRCAQPKGKP